MAHGNRAPAPFRAGAQRSVLTGAARRSALTRLAPRTARIGHVHLKVVDPERAIGSYSGVLGFEVQQRMGTQAAFLGAGGYRHHLGPNTWESAGAGGAGCRLRDGAGRAGRSDAKDASPSPNAASQRTCPAPGSPGAVCGMDGGAPPPDRRRP